MKMANMTTCMVDERNWREAAPNSWMLRHYEDRLAYLREKGADKTHPEIVRRYEEDINALCARRG